MDGSCDASVKEAEGSGFSIVVQSSAFSGSAAAGGVVGDGSVLVSDFLELFGAEGGNSSCVGGKNILGVGNQLIRHIAYFGPEGEAWELIG